MKKYGALIALFPLKHHCNFLETPKNILQKNLNRHLKHLSNLLEVLSKTPGRNSWNIIENLLVKDQYFSASFLLKAILTCVFLALSNWCIPMKYGGLYLSCLVLLQIRNCLVQSTRNHLKKFCLLIMWYNYCNNHRVFFIKKLHLNKIFESITRLSCFNV